MYFDTILSRRTISKKQICLLLGLHFSNGRCDLRSLRENYFKEEILIDLGLTAEEYKRIRIFDAVKTKIIIGRFKLNLIQPSLAILLR